MVQNVQNVEEMTSRIKSRIQRSGDTIFSQIGFIYIYLIFISKWHGYLSIKHLVQTAGLRKYDFRWSRTASRLGKLFAAHSMCATSQPSGHSFTATGFITIPDRAKDPSAKTSIVLSPAFTFRRLVSIPTPGLVSLDLEDVAQRVGPKTTSQKHETRCLIWHVIPFFDPFWHLFQHILV